MTAIRIDIEKLRGIAGAARSTYTGPAREAVHQLNGLQNALRGAWSAQAQSALDSAFGNWLAGFDRRAQDLLVTSAFLRKTADDFEALDARLVSGRPDDLALAPRGGAGKSLHRPTPQGNGPSAGAPVAGSGGSLPPQTFNGTAYAGDPLGITSVQLAYRADYAVGYYPDRVVLALTQYPSTNQIATPTHWSTSATVITRSGRELQYNIDSLEPNPIARPESATLTVPIDPNDPPVRVDLYINNVSDGPAGAFPSRQFYNSINLQTPTPAPTPTLTGPYAPTPTPNPVPDLSGPKPIQVPTPAPTPTPSTPAPGPGVTPTRPTTPSRPRGPVIPD